MIVLKRCMVWVIAGMHKWKVLYEPSSRFDIGARQSDKTQKMRFLCFFQNRKLKFSNFDLTSLSGDIFALMQKYQMIH